MNKNNTKLYGILAVIPLFLLSLAILPANTEAQSALTTPEFVSPENGEVLTTAEFDELDWSNTTGGTAPYQYRYQVFSDPEYEDMVFQSAWLSTSRASTANTPEGDYFFRVRARDSDDPRLMSAWSNGVDDEYLISIDNDGDDGDDDDDDDDDFPTNKQDCKQGGWMGFSFPFWNQGRCVSSVNHMNRYNGWGGGFNTNTTWGNMNWNRNSAFTPYQYSFNQYPYGGYGGNWGGMMNSAYGGFGHYGYGRYGGMGGWNQ